MITVTHKPSGKVREFEHPRDVMDFLKEYDAHKLNRKDLSIDNLSGLSLWAYQPRIPRDAQELIEKLERHFNTFGSRPLVPVWRWRNKRQPHCRATTVHTKNYEKCKYVSVTANSNPLDYLGIIIHEFAHVLEPEEHHNRKFYRTMFAMLSNRKFVSLDVETYTTAREFLYRKSSRYWYAEMFELEDILAEYHRPEPRVASRLTTAQKAAKAAELLFGEE